MCAPDHPPRARAAIFGAGPHEVDLIGDVVVVVAGLAVHAVAVGQPALEAYHLDVELPHEGAAVEHHRLGDCQLSGAIVS
eukprot:COSAG01_NODE_6460_length_3656_cov_5.809952_3_plen_80_part_00